MHMSLYLSPDSYPDHSSVEFGIVSLAAEIYLSYSDMSVGTL